jgi:cytochrome c oxidase subunit 2
LFQTFIRGAPGGLLFAFLATSLEQFSWVARADAAEQARGQALPWQMNLQAPATPVMNDIWDFWLIVLIIITAIAAFVLVLLVYVMWRYAAKRNPTPSKLTHSTPLEVLWTVIPVVILVFIAIPSFKLHYFLDVVPDSELTVKATGNQFLWSYDYPDHDLAFDSVMLEDEELAESQPRLLAVDNRLVVPVDTKVRVLITAGDVIHAWAVPAFGVKIDAIPGRLNETWFEAQQEGVFYGQCSELCGPGHGYMPIAVEVVSKSRFRDWLETATAEQAPGRRDVMPGTALAKAGLP